MNTLQPYQQRVVDEYSELFKKTQALGIFFGTKTYLALDKAEQDRLSKQWQLMQQLGLVLSERIASFNSHDSNERYLRDSGLHFVMALVDQGAADESGFSEGVVTALKKRLVKKGIKVLNFSYTEDKE